MTATKLCALNIKKAVLTFDTPTDRKYQVKDIQWFHKMLMNTEVGESAFDAPWYRR